MQSMSRFFILALVGCRALLAQSPNALVSEAKFPWTIVRDNLLKMAEKMPSENYSFKPVPEIESFGQRLAHIAGANLFVCQGVLGRQTSLSRPAATSKPELIVLLKQASATCDSTFESLSDTTISVSFRQSCVRPAAAYFPEARMRNSAVVDIRGRKASPVCYRGRSWCRASRLSANQCGLKPFGRRDIPRSSDEGTISSDGGALLLRRPVL